jgi:hypothetical protein
MIRNSYGRFPALRRKRLSPAVLSQEQLRNALIRAVVLEHRNGQSRAFPGWGWEKPTSMYVLRAQRLSLAREYARQHRKRAAVTHGFGFAFGQSCVTVADLRANHFGAAAERVTVGA